MNRIFSIIVLVLLLGISAVSDSPTNKVDVVVVGMVNHGPMQPTINSIKEVTSGYPDVTLRLIDLQTEEGQKYAQEQGLTAHLNIVINGRYQYNINGKEVTFQWFEGQQWTKEDLDAVISNILKDKENAVAVNDVRDDNRADILAIWTGILAIAGAIAWFLIKKFK